MSLEPGDGRRLEESLRAGGIAVIPTDTVYGLACDPCDGPAVERLYHLKGRPAARPAALMFTSLEGALAELPDLEPAERRATAALLPGPVTVVLANPERRFPLACGPRPERIGLRVPDLGGSLAPLAELRGAILQSSANPSGGADPGRVAEIAPEILAGVDLVLDAGPLPGRASSVVDLSSGHSERRWLLLREGALSAADLERALAPAGWARGLPDC